MRGAWIEIATFTRLVLAVIGRSPCGERGLKFMEEVMDDQKVMSLPMRGAWIEIDVEAELTM